MIILRVKGMPLTREPASVDDEGFSVFHLNEDKVDWREACNNARAQVFPNMKLPAVDLVFEDIMRARRA